MAKDTEKLIRQLSLISYLMAEQRPVTALEIRRDVEGYSGMNEDAFARRFYADRAELLSLGIQLQVEKPADGSSEQENYSLPPENFHLPAIEFTDAELAALQTALSLLDGEFAYAEPFRLALQQLTWGRPDPLKAPEQRSVALGITGAPSGHEISSRLTKIETAIFRRKTITFDYYTMGRDEIGSRKVDPYQILYQGGQFYLVGYSHERDATRVFRLSRMQGKIAYATKSEHDFERPEDFDPRSYAGQIDWQLNETVGTAEIAIDEKIIWQIERHFGRHGEIVEIDGEKVFRTEYGSSRQLISWVLGLGKWARLLGPTELIEEYDERSRVIVDLHDNEPDLAPVDKKATAVLKEVPVESNGKREATIRPERFARLVTLASILITAGRADERLQSAELLERLQISSEELNEDLNVLNVVNFGGGSYVLYAEIHPNGEIEVDPEPYSDNFARPARLLPIEAKSLVAAIDLIGDHLPEGSLESVRKKVVDALGADPIDEGLQFASSTGDDREIARVLSSAITKRQLVKLEYFKENEGVFSERTVEPYALMNGREGWYLASFDPSREAVRHFRLDRIKQTEILDKKFEPRAEVDPSADIEGWPRTGEVDAARRARVWVSPERARWAREDKAVIECLKDGSVIVEIGYGSNEWIVREILKEAGDAAVIEPPELREEVLTRAKALSAVAHA